LRLGCRFALAGVPELAAEILIFDLWVANGDRHRGNLAYLPAERRLDVFDHSHALLGAAPANSVARYTDVVARGDFVVDGHCLLAELRVANDLVNAVDRCLATARDAAIERVCEDSIALGLVSKADGPQLIGDLLQRQGALKDLLRIYQAKFTGIDPASWGFV
jgi:hypothetical protein